MKLGCFLMLMVGLVVWAGWSWSMPNPQPATLNGSRAAERTQAAAVEPPTVSPAGSAADRQDPQRIAATPAADDGEEGFSCVEEDGEPVQAAVRDGLVVELRNADGIRLGHQKVAIHWRKGWGNYGWDRGRTETDGSFASTVAMPQSFQEFVCEVPSGKFVFGGFPTPLVQNPRRVVFQLPRLAEMRFVVRDLQRAPVAGAWLQINSLPLSGDGCENILCPAGLGSLQTDAEGVVRVPLPPGAGHVYVGLLEDERHWQTEFRVPLAGGEVDLTLPQPANRYRVDISVQAAPEAGPIRRVHVSNHGAPPASRSPLVLGSSATTQVYEVQGSGGEYWAMVDAMPLQVQVQSQAGWHASTKLVAGQRTVHLVLQPPAPPKELGPVAELLVTLAREDGGVLQDAELRLHQASRLEGEPIAGLQRNGSAKIRQAATGARFCLSAKASGAPFVVSDVMELREGTQEINLVLPSVGKVRGMVVDADGKPAGAQVSLVRPELSVAGLLPDGTVVLPLHSTDSSTWSGEDGRFELHSVGPGEHEVLARYRQFALPARAKVRAGDEVTLQPGEGFADLHMLAVKVVDADRGEPLANSGIRVAGALTDVYYDAEKGCFLVAVRLGQVSLEVRALDYVSQQHSLVVRQGQAPMVLRMLASPVRRLRFVDAAGDSIRNAYVMAKDLQGQPMQLLTALVGDLDAAEVDRNGCVELRGLPAGPCKLQVVREYVGEEKKVIRELDLPAGAGIELRHTLVWGD